MGGFYIDGYCREGNLWNGIELDHYKFAIESDVGAKFRGLYYSLAQNFS